MKNKQYTRAIISSFRFTLPISVCNSLSLFLPFYFLKTHTQVSYYSWCREVRPPSHHLSAKPTQWEQLEARIVINDMQWQKQWPKAELKAWEGMGWEVFGENKELTGVQFPLWFSKYGPRTNSSTGNLLGMQIPSSNSLLTESEALGVRFIHLFEQAQ